MKRVNNPYAIEMVSERGREFLNDARAIYAATAIQTYFTLNGYLTSSYLDKETKTYEVTVHFDLGHYPSNPKGYHYSDYAVTSSRHYRYERIARVRCKTYKFRVVK